MGPARDDAASAAPAVPLPGEVAYRRQIEDGDPLLAAAARRGIRPVTLGITVAVVVTLIRMAVAWSEGHLSTVSPVGFLRDPAAYLNAAFGAAAIAWYAWTPAGLARLVAGLVSNGVFRLRDDRSHIDSLVARLADRRWSLYALAATVIFAGVELRAYLARMREQDAWSMATPASVTLSLIWAAVGIYSVFRVITYYALARGGFRRLFTRYEVRIRPLHPDRSGGLAPLGAFSIRISYLMTVIAVFIMMTMLTRSYLAYGEARLVVTADIAAGVIIFAVLSAFVFFSLPAVAHESMLRAKNRLLLRINRRFEAEYRQLHGILGKADVELGPGVERLGKLYELYETTARFPVWPFDVQTVSRFITSWVTPVLIALLTTAVKAIIG